MKLLYTPIKSYTHTVEAVIAVMKKNVSVARRALTELLRALPDPKKSRAHGATTGAIMTAPEMVSPRAKQSLAWLLSQPGK